MATTKNNLQTNYRRALKVGLVFSILGLAYTTFLLPGILLLAIGLGGQCYARWTAK